MSMTPVTSSDTAMKDGSITDVINLETPKASVLSPSATFFANAFLSGDVPSTAEIIQKCLAVNPFELKFREANRRLSQSQDDSNGLSSQSFSLPTSAGISMLKLSSSLNQSPTIFTNINLLSADLDLPRKLKESGFMNCSKTEGNRTPCTADVLNAVLDMNMNNQNITVSVAASQSNMASYTNHNITSTDLLINDTNPLRFNLSCSTKINQPLSINNEMNEPLNDKITPNNLLTSLQPSLNNNLLASQRTDMEKPTATIINIDDWDTNDIKPDINNEPPLKKIATEKNTTPSTVQYQSEDSPFSNNSNTSNANSRQSSEPNRTTRKYQSKCNSVNSSHKGGRGRRSITNDMAPDERRQTILERNKAAAVRYRKRKKEEHDEMITRVNMLERDKNAYSTQNAVLRREVERLTELLKLRDSQCVCHASQLGNSQSLLSSLDTLNNSNYSVQSINGTRNT